jgi:hypothetical protein
LNLCVRVCIDLLIL